MARENHQLFLNAPGCSWRAVRYRTLKPSEADAALLVAAKIAGPEASQAELQVHTQRECVRRMLVAVTSKGDLVEAEVPTAAWTNLDAGTLEMPGPFSYDELFTVKDDAVLSTIYQRAHGITKAELEAISGKALPVSAG